MKGRVIAITEKDARGLPNRVCLFVDMEEGIQHEDVAQAFRTAPLLANLGFTGPPQSQVMNSPLKRLEEIEQHLKNAMTEYSHQTAPIGVGITLHKLHGMVANLLRTGDFA